MRVYALTKLGDRVISNRTGGDDDEFRILAYLKDNKTGTESELEVVGEKRHLRFLQKRGLIKELTT